MTRSVSHSVVYHTTHANSLTCHKAAYPRVKAVTRLQRSLYCKFCSI